MTRSGTAEHEMGFQRFNNDDQRLARFEELGEIGPVCAPLPLLGHALLRIKAAGHRLELAQIQSENLLGDFLRIVGG